MKTAKTAKTKLTIEDRLKKLDKQKQRLELSKQIQTLRNQQKALAKAVIFFSILALTAARAGAQAPNCNLLNQVIASATNGTQYNNSQQNKCSVWKLTYWSTGFSVLSIQIEGAPDNGSGAPGTWAAVTAGFVVTGSNPSSTTTSAQITVNNYYPWMRVNVTSVTGTGQINYNLIGTAYLAPAASSSAASISGNITAIGPDANAVPPTQNPVQDSGWDGTNVRRLRTDTSGALAVAGTFLTGQDGVPNGQWVGLANPSSNNAFTILPTADLLYNPVANQWDRPLEANATTTASASKFGKGSQLSEKGARFSFISNPAAGSQATGGPAAGGAGVIHIADCVAFSAASTTAPALTALTVNLRDGATGAGTIIWTYQLAITATAGQNVTPFSVCGLGINGTANTAMTLEFSASLANLIESVSLSGYNVQ